MSNFDPDTFLSQEHNQSSETKYTPVPEKDYQVVLDDKIEIRQYTNATSGVVSTILDVTHNIMEGQVPEELGLTSPAIRDSIFLDIEADGTLNFGPNKNVKLGKLRDALGQNIDGQPWNFNMLRGAGPLLIRVVVKPRKDDNDILDNRVQRYAALTGGAIAA